MTTVLLIVTVAGGLCVLLVALAGAAVWQRHATFSKSSDRQTVLAIAEEYRQRLVANEPEVEELVASGRREVVHRASAAYSVDLAARRLKAPRTFEVVVSVGRLRLITVGHAEKFDVVYGHNG